MKKKFVLTSALVLIVVASLVAATPIEVSGKFSAGYTFEFSPNKVSDAHGAEATINSVFEGDFWKVTLAAGGNLEYGKNSGLDATAEIYLDKALEAEGVDLGDFAVTLHVGNDVAKGGHSVFADKAEFKNIAVAMTTPENFGLTLGYGSLVKVYFAAYPWKGLPMVVGATVTPLDGLSVAASFSNEADALNASVKADVAELADLDFGLVASAGYKFDLGAKAHNIGVDVVADVADVDLFVAYATDLAKHTVVAGAEYIGIDLTVTFDTDGSTHGLNVEAGYGFEVAGFDISVGGNFGMADLSAKAFSYGVEASAGYKLGGVDYNLELGYVDGGPFTVTPSLSIAF